MVGVLDADHLADLYNLFIGGEQQFFRLFNADLIQVLYGCVFIIFCELAAQAVFVDAVLESELVEGVGLLVSYGKAMVHVCDVGRDMVGAGLLDRAHEIELREETDKIARAHHCVNLRVGVVFQNLFPGTQDIRIFVKPIDEISKLLYFLQVTFKNGSAHKTDRIVPDIVLADQFVVPAAVDDREGAFGQVISRMDSVRVFAVQLSGSVCRVHEADRVEVRSFIGEWRRDRHTFVAQLTGKDIAEIVFPAVCVLKIIGQGEAVARLGRDQAAEKLSGK